MSGLQKMWAKNRLNHLPPQAFDEREEDNNLEESSDQPSELLPVEGHMDDDSSSASSASSTGTIIPSPRQNLFARPQGLPPRRTLEQIPWTTFFERELFLSDKKIEGSSDGGGSGGSGSVVHHAYLTSPVGKGPLFVMHHGAGSSGLSFAVISAEIRKRLPSAGILSVDARGHGSTAVSGAAANGKGGSDLEEEGVVDLSLSTLTDDLQRTIELTRVEMRWDGLPPILLVGHSLGGAVVTELANRGVLGGNLLGYAVLDVVEGSAMDALTSMQTYLSTRPLGFTTVEAGISWHVQSRTIRNSLSARASVPSLLVSSQQQSAKQPRGNNSTEANGGGGFMDQLPSQDDNNKEGQQNDSVRSDPRPWKWRTDLAATQPFWEDWFVGLSKKFLSARGGKLLLLAGTDRLDTELTIGQMQGKYALQVFPEAGHFIHEDLPEKTAISLVDFHRRNDRSALVLPPKVGDLLKQGKRV